MVDARTVDGSRLNAIIEPVAVDGPALTIRRFSAKRLSLAELIENDTELDITLEDQRGILL